MNKYYLINGKFEFHPVTGLLFEITNPENNVSLNSPVARCLLLLLKNTGDIVTKNIFLEEVWVNRGLGVTPSTFYQNISLLRKDFKRVGLDPKLIITIPRIGLTLSNDLKIVVVNPNEDHASLSQVSSHLIIDKEKKYIPEGELIADHNFNVDFFDGNTLKQDGNIDCFIFLKTFLNKKTIRIGTIIMVILSLLTYSVFFSVRNERFFFEDNYSLHSVADGCHFFINKGISSISQKEIALSYGRKYKKGCDTYPWLYITWFPDIKRASVIRCNNSMEFKNTCISHYFFEG
ncbi:winged helix-turn-helix domain-containing protein [Klebsiella aerogenes]